MGPIGSLSVFMRLYGSKGVLTGPYASIWHLKGLNGSLSVLLRPYGFQLVFILPYVSLWILMGSSYGMFLVLMQSYVSV